MQCPVCGAQNEAAAAFCYQCGSSLKSATAPTRPTTGPTVALDRDEQPSSGDLLSRERQPELLSAPEPRPLSIPGAGLPPLRPPSLEPSASNARVYSGPPASDVYAMPSVRTSNLATVSLILGILAWTLLPVFAGIGAVITGHMARREIVASNGQLSGSGMATAGLILGYASLVVAVLGVLAFCALFSAIGFS